MQNELDSDTARFLADNADNDELRAYISDTNAEYTTELERAIKAHRIADEQHNEAQRARFSRRTHQTTTPYTRLTYRDIPATIRPTASGKTGAYLSRGPWAQLIGARAICPDGIIRTIRCGTPDTYFSAPGRTRVAGVNVSGFISTDDSFMWVPEADAHKYTSTGYHLPASMTNGELLVDCPTAGEYRFHVAKNHPAYTRMLDAIAARQTSPTPEAR